MDARERRGNWRERNVYRVALTIAILGLIAEVVVFAPEVIKDAARQVDKFLPRNGEQIVLFSNPSQDPLAAQAPKGPSIPPFGR